MFGGDVVGVGRFECVEVGIGERFKIEALFDGFGEKAKATEDAGIKAEHTIEDHLSGADQEGEIVGALG